MVVADGRPADGYRTLLEEGRWIIEGLDLTDVEEGYHRLICCPLNVESAVSAPVRVLVSRIKEPVSVKGFQLPGRQE